MANVRLDTAGLRHYEQRRIIIGWADIPDLVFGGFIMRSFCVGVLCCLMAFLSGCATITKGTTQPVAVLTPGVNGATCTLTSSSIGSKVVQTPGTVVLEKSQEAINVVCKKACYQDAVGIIPSHTEGMTAGNVLVGGVVGLGVDAISGAMNKYNDNNQFTMIPIPGCRA